MSEDLSLDQLRVDYSIWGIAQESSESYVAVHLLTGQTLTATSVQALRDLLSDPPPPAA